MSNEAAERLLALIRDRFDPISREARPLLDEALNVERLRTTARLRQEVFGQATAHRGDELILHFETTADVFDAEALR